MITEKFKTLISKESNGNSKRKIENLVVFIIILIITIIAINAIWTDKKETKTKDRTDSQFGKQLATTNETKEQEKEETKSIEENLENILSQIDGVGKVKVLVTYSQTSEVIAIYKENSKNSTIEEKDSGGGTRITEQQDTTKDIVYQEENGQKTPITQKVISPKVEGAIITASRSK